MKIFVVEDSKEKFKEIASLLEKIEDVSLELAGEYVQAREKIKRNSYDILILDMTLPRANDTRKFRSHAGKELMFDMKDAGINIPTIVVTGYLDFGSTNNISKEIDKLPVMIKNEKYGCILEEYLDKIYDISNFYGIHEFLSDNIPFYLGIIYFQLQQSIWKKGLLQLIEESMRERNESFTIRR